MLQGHPLSWVSPKPCSLTWAWATQKEGADSLLWIEYAHLPPAKYHIVAVHPRPRAWKSRWVDNTVIASCKYYTTRHQLWWVRWKNWHRRLWWWGQGTRRPWGSCLHWLLRRYIRRWARTHWCAPRSLRGWGFGCIFGRCWDWYTMCVGNGRGRHNDGLGNNMQLRRN